MPRKEITSLYKISKAAICNIIFYITAATYCVVEFYTIKLIIKLIFLITLFGKITCIIYAAHPVRYCHHGRSHDGRFVRRPAPDGLGGVYASAAIVTGGIYLGLEAMDVSRHWATIIAAAAGLVLRLLAIRYEWQMPKFVYEEEWE